MPALDADQLEQAIRDGNVKAISIDTSVFDQFECNLQYATLTALERYPKVGIQLVFADVTLTEVRSHIETALAAAQEKARAGLNQYGKAWRLDLSAEEIRKRLGAPSTPSERADHLVGEFTTRIGATAVVVADHVKTSEVLQAWTAGSPPFGAKEGKKNEFPDAFALLALESWARQNKTIVLAVSRDDDWAGFAKRSKHVVVAKNLKAALDLFNVADRAAALQIVERLNNAQQAAGLRSTIDRALELYLENFEADGNSYYYFEIENGPAAVAGWSVAEKSDVRVLAADADSLTIAFNIDAKMDFEISVELQQRDGVDKDYVSLGYHHFETQVERTLPVTLTLYREEGDADADGEAEIADRPLVVDFGDLEPDWGYEE